MNANDGSNNACGVSDWTAWRSVTADEDWQVDEAFGVDGFSHLGIQDWRAKEPID